MTHNTIRKATTQQHKPQGKGQHTMTPDRKLALDSALLLCMLLCVGTLTASLCSSESVALDSVEEADLNPLAVCAEEVKALHPRHQSILVHGSPRREEVNHGLALWYCRKLTPRGVESAMRALNPLTAEELATW